MGGLKRPSPVVSEFGASHGLVTSQEAGDVWRSGWETSRLDQRTLSTELRGARVLNPTIDYPPGSPTAHHGSGVRPGVPGCGAGPGCAPRWCGPVGPSSPFSCPGGLSAVLAEVSVGGGLGFGREAGLTCGERWSHWALTRRGFWCHPISWTGRPRLGTGKWLSPRSPGSKR